MIRDMLRQSDIDVSDKFTDKERKDLLRTLGNEWGGMSGAPQCYSVHAGLDRNDSEGIKMKNNLILFGNTAELRKGVLVYSRYSWDSKTGEISFDPEIFNRDVENNLRYAGYPQTEENIDLLAGLYYNNGNQKVYDNFDDLKKDICELGFPTIGENLIFRKSQNDWKKEKITLSLNSGTILTSEKYWQSYALVDLSRVSSGYLGQFVLMD